MPHATEANTVSGKNPIDLTYLGVHSLTGRGLVMRPIEDSVTELSVIW